MQWFRMYAEAVDDEKLRMLAFEDRWHFVALLCCKAAGTLDTDPSTLERRLTIKLGLEPLALHETKKRLQAILLIDEKWQPLGWKKRQYLSDNSTSRVQKHRRKRTSSKKRPRNVSETAEKRFRNAPDTESEAETESDKNSSVNSSPDLYVSSSSPTLRHEDGLHSRLGEPDRSRSVHTLVESLRAAKTVQR